MLAAAAAAAAAAAVIAADSSTVQELKAQLSFVVKGAQAEHYVAAVCALGLVYGVWCRLTAPPPFRRDAVGQPRNKCVSEAATIAQLPAMVEEVRSTFKQGATRSYAWRIQQLRGLQALVIENTDEIFEAARADCGKTNAEWFFERKSILADCALAISQLHRWMRPVHAASPFWMQPATSYTLHEPFGTVLVVAPWNYPITLAIQPLVGAFAAGNTAVLKPSELAPHQSRVLAKLLPQYIDSSALLVVEGGVEVSKAVIQQPFDFVFYTGGPAVGSHVAQECSKRLTPFCLELGGKSPTLVDKSVDLVVACNRIVQGKYANAGQTCIAPDYVLVHSEIRDDFVQTMKRTIETQLGTDVSKSPLYGRIINEGHWSRVCSYLENISASQVLHGGESDQTTRYISPTLIGVTSADLDKPLMTDEIFGPLLPILTVQNMDEAINFVNARPKPLAAYIFSSDRHTVESVLSRTTSGTACVNDCVFQFLNAHLPFGGVGPSGSGSYHGHASFKEFSHVKSVLKHATWSDWLPPYHLRYPPHPDKPWVQTMFSFLMDI